MPRHFSSPFFIIQRLLVPKDLEKKDFEFFRMFVELFVFLIDSLTCSSLGSRDSPVINLPRSRPKLVHKNTCWCQFSKESRLIPNEKDTMESWLLLYYSQVIFVNRFWCWYQNDQEIQAPFRRCIHHRGVKTPWGVETPWCGSSQGSFSDTWESFYEFLEHAITFTGIIIQNIDCGLFHLPNDLRSMFE